MSIAGRQVSGRAVVFVVLLLLVVGALVRAGTMASAREMTLIARGMAFYLEDDPHTPNPTIELRAGERVRIVLLNQDRGLVHDFAVPALHATARAVAWNQRSEVTFEVPDAPGTYEYACMPHRLMMSGIIMVATE
jgi:plastocyanin